MGGLKDRYIRFDWAIKRLLRQKANFDVLEGFLTVFIGEEVKIVEILEVRAISKRKTISSTVWTSKHETRRVR